MAGPLPPQRPIKRTGVWHTYTTFDGLAGLQTESLAEDVEGYMWIGSWDNGVSCFDGDQFLTFTQKDGLAGNQVMAIHCDSRGVLWFGTFDGGACWYDGKAFQQLEGTGKIISFIAEDDRGQIWFGGPDTLGYWDGARYRDLRPLYQQTIAPKLARCAGIAQDGEGHLWFGFDRVARYDGRQFHPIGEASGLVLSKPITFIGIIADGAGGLWLSNQRQIFHYDGDYCHLQDQKAPGPVRKLRRDKQGNVWIATTGGGVLAWDGTSYWSIDERDGLAYSAVNDVFEDTEGQLWFATWGGGVNCYDPYSLELFGAIEGMPTREVTSLAHDDQGRIWAGYSSFWLDNDRLSRLVDGKIEVIDDSGDLGSALARAQRPDSIWLGGSGGLFLAGPQGIEKIGAEAGFDGHTITALAESEDGLLYVGHWTMADGDRLLQISRWDGQTRTCLYSKNYGDANIRVSTLIPKANGELLFGLFAQEYISGVKGLGRWHPTEGLTFWGRAEGLVDDRVSDIIEDRHGHLWIATLDGLSYQDGATFKNYTTESGLPHNGIFCLYCDNSGLLWLGTDGGLVRYNGQFFQTLLLPQVLATTQITEGSDGDFWLATRKGIIRYIPHQTPPRIRIIQTIADRLYPGSQPIEIPASPQIIFEYKGIGFRTHPRNMLYTYRLLDHQEAWSQGTDQQRAYYHDLPAGQYTFQVCAIDRDLNRSEPASLSITIVSDAREDRLQAFKEVLLDPSHTHQFIGQSQALYQSMEQMASVANTDLTVLILGETGTGKGLMARTIHDASPRQEGPFIQVNCGAIPEGLIESELFGHEQGAFTGATERKIGRFELADKGTIFLDEIGDLPLPSQRVLLQVLQDRTLHRIGGQQSIQVDVRVVAATNRDLAEEVRQSIFRQDLYYRLSSFVLTLPPLRERGQDISILLHYFVERFANHLHRPPPQIAPEALAQMMTYHWPGNVRELEHIAQRAVLTCTGDLIRAEDLALFPQRNAAQSRQDTSLSQEMQDLKDREKSIIETALTETNWIVYGQRGAAQVLGIHPEKLRSRMRILGIEKPRSTD